jgi:hypothetical protein
LFAAQTVDIMYKQGCCFTPLPPVGSACQPDCLAASHSIAHHVPDLCLSVGTLKAVLNKRLVTNHVLPSNMILIMMLMMQTTEAHFDFHRSTDTLSHGTPTSSSTNTAVDQAANLLGHYSAAGARLH